MSERPPEASRRSWRWALGTLPWPLVVGVLAVLDAVGCAPAPSDEPTAEPDYGDDDDDGPAGDDDDTLGGPYPAVVQPEFDAIDVSRLAGVWADFSEELLGATIALADETGAAVPGSSAPVGAVRVLFLPDAPLRPATAYTVTIAWGARTLSYAFTTRASGPPVGPVDDVFAWAITQAGASSPPGAEGFVGALPLDVLTDVQAGKSGASALVGVAGADGVQDPCVPTFTPAATRWEDPLLVAEGGVLRLAVDLSIAGLGRTVLPLRDPRFAAELVATPDGLRLADGAFSAWIDAREVTVQGVCDTLEGVAVACVPCPDGPALCLRFWLEDVQGGVLGPPLVPRGAAEVKADPACQPPG